MLSKPVLASAALAGLAAAAPKQARSCNPDFKNIVFNSNVNDQPDIVGRFSTIQGFGVSKWIGFTAGDPSPADPVLVDNQIKMVVSGANIEEGLALITGPNPPEYLQLLNEPDGGFYDLPIYEPAEAAQLIQPFLDADTTTKFLSPAPAYPDRNFLTEFFAACNCEDRFPVILAHVYANDAPSAIAAIEKVIADHPGKPVWVTELSPSSDPAQGCTLNEAEMIDWMNQVVGWASTNDAVERVFWNAGEYGELFPEDPARCNPSLTNTDGSARPLLEAYGSICA